MIKLKKNQKTKKKEYRRVGLSNLACLGLFLKKKKTRGCGFEACAHA